MMRMSTFKFFVTEGSPLEKSKSAHLDALARRSVWRGGGIFERCVRRKPCPAVGLGIVNLKHQSFVSPHLREVEPPVLWIVLQSVSLPYSMRITAFGDHKIVERDTLGVGNGQGI